jgi:hypothetical protein
MSRERDRNTKKFHKGQYEIIAARFREEFSKYVNADGQAAENDDIPAIQALAGLCHSLAARFEFDSDEFDREIFLSRCSPVEMFDIKDW